MKPENFLACCVLAVVIWTSVPVKASSYVLAFLNSYDERKFYVFYDGRDAPSDSEFKISSAAAGQETAFTSMGSDPSTDLNAMECPVYADGQDPVQSLFKFCIATVGALNEEVWLTNTDVEVAFKNDTSSGNGTVARFFARDMSYIPGRYPLTDNETANWDILTPTFGGEGNFHPDIIGFQGAPNRVQPYLDSSTAHLKFLAVMYSGTPDSDFTKSGSGYANITGGGAITQIGDDLAFVRLYYTALSNGHICGVQLPGTIFGCNNFSEELPIEDGYAFAGFVSLTSDLPAGDNFLLLPLQFKMLETRVLYYQNENSDSSKFTIALVNNPTQLMLFTYILDTRNETTGGAAFTPYTHNVTLYGNESMIEIDLLEYKGEKLDRPCTMLMGTLMTNNNESSQFTAFTGGYTIDTTVNLSWPENFIADGNETVYTTLPKHDVIDGMPEEMGQVCDLDFIGKTHEIGMENGVLAVKNGGSTEFLGPQQGSVVMRIFELYQIVNSIDIHYNSTTNVIRGLRFRFTDTATVGIGEALSSYNHAVYNLNYTGSGILSYLKVHMRGSEMVKLEAFWMQPAAPWNIWTQPVKDYATGFYKGFFNESGEYDADQMEVRFWLPFDSTASEAITMSINGSFERGNQVSADLYLDGSMTSFMRGADFTTRAYYLMAQTSYTFNLHGMNVLAIANGLGFSSLTSEEQSFVTPNGARLSCTQDANMTYQIEYESVPEIGVNAELGDEVVFGNPSNNPVTTDDFAAHTFCDPHDCFQFNYSVNQFRGFIKRVEIYYINGTDDYIRGFTVYYKEADGGNVSFELSGGTNNTNNSITQYVDFEDEGTLPAGFDYDSQDGRLARIQFKDINNASIGECMGPNMTAGNCSTVGPRTIVNGSFSPIDYYICGFKMNISNNQTAEPGVFSMAPMYAAIDFPTLLRSSRSSGCELMSHLDYFYVRNSAWDFTQDIMNVTHCGTQQKIYNLGDTTDTRRADEIDPGFNHSVVYYQVVTRERDDQSDGQIQGEGGVYISRAGLWEATAFCYYDAEGQVHSSFNVTGEDGLSMHGTNEFKYKMQIAQSSAFTSFFDPSAATAVLDDEVYVKVSFDGEVSDGFTLITTDCWATQTTDSTSNVRYILSEDKCPKDTTFERLPGSAMDMEYFQFKAFGWYVSGNTVLDTVYLHCKVLACHPNDTSPCDTSGCTKRQKRELSSAMDTLSSDGGVNSKVRSGFVSSSPIVVVRRDTDSQLNSLTGPKSQYSPLTASLASVFTLAALIALLVAIGLFVVKQKNIAAGRTYHILDSNNVDDEPNFSI